jgi:hypothetical protein
MIHLIIELYVDRFVELILMYQVNESIQKMFHYVKKKVIDNNMNKVDWGDENQNE